MKTLSEIRNETWKDISGYDGIYQVSDFGRVRSVKKNRIMNQCKKSNGYLHLALSKNGEVKYFHVHRLVAMAFLPEVPGKGHVNHKDGIKDNNDVSNLEWCNRSENMQHAYDMRLQPVRYAMNSAARKLTENQVLCIINLRKNGELIKNIAAQYNVTATCISYIVNRKCWNYLTDSISF